MPWGLGLSGQTMNTQTDGRHVRSFDWEEAGKTAVIITVMSVIIVAIAMAVLYQKGLV